MERPAYIVLTAPLLRRDAGQSHPGAARGSPKMKPPPPALRTQGPHINRLRRLTGDAPTADARVNDLSSDLRVGQLEFGLGVTVSSPRTHAHPYLSSDSVRSSSRDRVAAVEQYVRSRRAARRPCDHVVIPGIVKGGDTRRPTPLHFPHWQRSSRGPPPSQ